MIQISILPVLTALYNGVKRQFGKIVQNDYLSLQEKINAINSGNLYYSIVGNTTFLILKDIRTCRLIYYSPSLADMEKDLASLTLPGVSSLIMEEMQRQDASPFSFLPNMTLREMIRHDVPGIISSASPHVQIPSASDLSEIESLLCSNFNPIFERVPDVAQLQRYHSDNGIYIFRNGSDILGVVIFEVKGKKIELKYWLTIAQARGNGVGAALMTEFFKAAKANNCSSMNLFVDVNNCTAISQYSRYGFKEEKKFDLIYKII